MPENIYTVKEVSAILKVPDATIERLVHTKKISHFKVSGKVRISEKHIQDYLKNIEVAPNDI